MTTTDLETAAASTVEEAAAACAKLDELMMGGLAGCFARVEPRRQARKYVIGLLSDLPGKNCWALAEQAGDATPDRMQRLLERAAWDAGAAMAAVRSFAVRYLGDPAGAVLVLDESGRSRELPVLPPTGRNARPCRAWLSWPVRAAPRPGRRLLIVGERARVEVSVLRCSGTEAARRHRPVMHQRHAPMRAGLARRLAKPGRVAGLKWAWRLRRW